MNEYLQAGWHWMPSLLTSLLPSVLAGAGAGLLFFGTLWWTVGRALASNRPARWFFASGLLRMGLLLGGLYGIAQIGHWPALLAGLAGFWLARMMIMRRVDHAS
jgi:F1F0 ATPase subunit 2